jgi:hypothetical protein
MPQYVCFVQEGQQPAACQAELSDGLRRLGRERLGDPAQGIEIRWTVVARGFGFSAGRPSTSSLVVREVAVGFPDPAREAFMRSVCELWKQVTGCTTDEIVVTAYDGPLPL